MGAPAGELKPSGSGRSKYRIMARPDRAPIHFFYETCPVPGAGKNTSPNIGRLMLEDAETGKVMEVNTGVGRLRASFQERQQKAQAELVRMFRSANIDSIQLLAGQPYAVALGKFFETREKRRLHG